MSEGEYETFESVRLSDSSEEFIRKDSFDFSYYDKKREKKQCMFVIIYFLCGSSILLLFVLIVCVILKLLNLIN